MVRSLTKAIIIEIPIKVSYSTWTPQVILSSSVSYCYQETVNNSTQPIIMCTPFYLGK